MPKEFFYSVTKSQLRLLRANPVLFDMVVTQACGRSRYSLTTIIANSIEHLGLTDIKYEPNYGDFFEEVLEELCGPPTDF